MIRRAPRIPELLCLVAILIALGTDSNATDEFHAFIYPDTSHADLYSIVDVHLDVDSTAQQFNGYEITFQFDPSVVSCDAMIPGELMTEACPNWFNHQTISDTTITYALVILCDLASVDGPGRLCSIRFSANAVGVSPVTIISDPDRSFFDAGLYVCPDHPTYPRQVIFHDGAIVVGDPTSDCADRIREQHPKIVRIRPNPVNEIARIDFELTQAERVQIVIYDSMGRVMCNVIDDHYASGTHMTSWDGTDNHGHTLANGTYFCRLQAGRFQSRSRIVLFR